MLKYVDTKVVFAEVPDEITLAINISGCHCHCDGCHSSYLAEDIGEELRFAVLSDLIAKHNGITCVAFMGGDAEPRFVSELAKWVKTNTGLKVAWYSGKSAVSDETDVQWFDFIKLGPYIKSLGPLESPFTNQRFYQISNKREFINITSRFQNQIK